MSESRRIIGIIPRTLVARDVQIALFLKRLQKMIIVADVTGNKSVTEVMCERVNELFRLSLFPYQEQKPWVFVPFSEVSVFGNLVLGVFVLDLPEMREPAGNCGASCLWVSPKGIGEALDFSPDAKEIWNAMLEHGVDVFPGVTRKRDEVPA